MNATLAAIGKGGATRSRSRPLLGAIGALGLLVLWELAARLVWRDAQVLPAPTQAIEAAWRSGLETLLREATLDVPTAGHQHVGGRSGNHSEHLGYLVAEMQHLHRAYPGVRW